MAEAARSEIEPYLSWPRFHTIGFGRRQSASKPVARVPRAVTLAAMRTKLRVAALLVAVVVTAWWFFSGPNLGWYKTKVERIEKDPVTELEVKRYEDRFVPGVDCLGGGLLLACALVGASFFVRKNAQPSQPGSV